MTKKKRLKKNKQRAMHRRMLRSKGPMTEEQKKALKIQRETDRETTKKRVAKEKLAKTSKVVKEIKEKKPVKKE
jgi:hypothetical protein